MDINEMESDATSEQNQRPPQIRVSNFAAQSANASNLVSVINQLQQNKQNDSVDSSNDITQENKADSVSMWIKKDGSNSSPIFISNSLITDIKIPAATHLRTAR